MTPPAGGGLQISRDAIARGAALALFIAIPAIIAAEIVDAIADLDPESNTIFVFYMVVVAALVVGGWRAGRRGPDAPLSNGAIAALVAYGFIALGTTVLRVAQGDPTDVVGLIFNGFIAASAGILGGMVAGRRPDDAGSAPSAAD